MINCFCIAAAGAEKTLQLFPDLDVPYTGLQHYLLAKMYWRKLLAERGTGRKGEGGGVREGVEEGAPVGVGEEGSQAGGKEEVKEEGGGDGEGEEEELKLEDLEPTLERCREALAISEDYGSRAYYFVNGALLSLVRCMQQVLRKCLRQHCNLPQDMFKLSSQMLDKVESEGNVPEKVSVSDLLLGKYLSSTFCGSI